MYYTDFNINYIKHQIIEIMRNHMKAKVIVCDEDIKRVMKRVLNEKPEDESRMNQRVVMYIVNEIKTHLLEKEKNLNFEENYVKSSGVYNNISKCGPDLFLFKPSKSPCTLKFYLTT